MKITPVLLLALLFVGVPALCDSKEELFLQTTAPTQAPRSRFAALDEVRLLANGLLHLGQSMREFVQKTRGQISDIFQKLNIFDRSFYQLSVLTSEIKEEEEELKKTTVVLKASNDEIKDLSAQISFKVDSILQEKSDLQDKLEGLEEKLSSMSKSAPLRYQAAEINSLRVRHLCLQRQPEPACVVVLVAGTLAVIFHHYESHTTYIHRMWLFLIIQCFWFILQLYFCPRTPSRVNCLCCDLT